MVGALPTVIAFAGLGVSGRLTLEIEQSLTHQFDGGFLVGKGCRPHSPMTSSMMFTGSVPRWAAVTVPTAVGGSERGRQRRTQLLAQPDRCFPGLTLALPDVLGTRIGCLVAAEFADPHRLAALGVTWFVRFAANRGLRVRRSAAERLGAG